jgi:hypothetical protein
LGVSHRYRYSGIGKDWSYTKGAVLPEDRGIWERFPGEAPQAVRDWAERLNEDMRLPVPYVLYEAYDVAFGELEEELHRCYLRALQRVTEPDEWVYAIDMPEVCWIYCYRFWPHRSRVRSRWYASPVPNGDGQWFLSQTFEWGILAFFAGGFEWEKSCVFGQRLIDAFDEQPPPGWRSPRDG